MTDERITCSACDQKTPRNMHNKCIYCGAPYPEKYWFSDDEKARKISQLKEDNEAARQQLEESKKKEKDKQTKRKQRDSTYIDSGF